MLSHEMAGGMLSHEMAGGMLSHEMAGGMLSHEMGGGMLSHEMGGGMKRVVTITGASRGIGRACALAFARRGQNLALLGRLSDGHERTHQECEQLGAIVHSYACDVTTASTIAQAAEQLLQELGPPQIVINNAGVLRRGHPVHETPIEDWDLIMATNLRGPFLLTRALLPAMLATGSGRLIHISSISGTIACPQASAYGASKWGLIGFAKSLSEELRGSGLQSMLMLPGSVDTDMLKATPYPADMTAEDVAEVIAYHALDAPNAMAGASVEIYGA